MISITIYCLHKQGCTQKFIAETIGKDKSVISRELKHNATPKGKYYFEYVQETVEMRKERMKIPRKLTSNLKKEIVKLN
ncbi:MAG: helix-turn-helix domain-containing protein [Paludibacter sp.]|nr:helix-turn-helix domain-containing protein [Paludibacter sp.]